MTDKPPIQWEWTAGNILMVIWIIVFWAIVIRWFKKHPSPEKGIRVPIAVMPIAYFLMLVNPAIDFMLYKMNLRRSKRIRAFLKLANDLRMRKKRIDGFFPRRPRS